MRNDVLGCVEILVLSVFTWFISAWLENTIYLLLASLILLFFSLFLYAGNALCGLYAPNKMNQ